MSRSEKPAPSGPLRQRQTWMLDAILTDSVSADDVAQNVTASSRLSAVDRFEIYRSGYHARLLECLIDDYPVLASMMGEEEFAALCRTYVGRFPSTSPNLNAFGRHMASLCREATELPVPPGFAADLATLEWALVSVLHAELSSALDVAALQAMAPDVWERARFVASDALRILHFAYPVNAVFNASRLHGIVPAVPDPAPTAVAVYRSELQLWRMDLTPAMVGVLGPLVAGKSLGEALAALDAVDTDPEVLAQTGASLMVWFREWVAAGFFTRIELDPP